MGLEKFKEKKEWSVIVKKKRSLRLPLETARKLSLGLFVHTCSIFFYLFFSFLSFLEVHISIVYTKGFHT